MEHDLYEFFIWPGVSLSLGGLGKKGLSQPIHGANVVHGPPINLPSTTMIVDQLQSVHRRLSNKTSCGYVYQVNGTSGYPSRRQVFLEVSVSFLINPPQNIRPGAVEHVQRDPCGAISKRLLREEGCALEVLRSKSGRAATGEAGPDQCRAWDRKPSSLPHAQEGRTTSPS